MSEHDPPPSNSAKLPPNDCDLVMKGGVTSGVVYPRLVAELASRYRFRNIGGTSAGAIAAAACAAAEYGRSHGNPAGFAELDDLPDVLGAGVGPGGRSKLFSLFQPVEAVRAQFEVLVDGLNAKPAEAVSRVLGGILRLHWGLVAGGLVAGSLLLWPCLAWLAPGLSIAAAIAVAFGALLGMALMLGLGLGRGASSVGRGVVLASVSLVLLAIGLHWLRGASWSLAVLGTDVAFWSLALLILAALLIAVIVRFAVSLLKGIHGNGYGLCSGSTTSTDGLPGLTDWLTGYLDGLAGLPAGHPPLSFGDLWGTADPDAPRQINLEVMTAAVSQKMVFGIPFRDDAPPFFYDPDEWKVLFPPAVMASLAAAVRPGETMVTSVKGKALRPLPSGAALPVVVAVRMSLSFPILLSAVPLYAVDRSRKRNQTHGDTPVATRIWFSDGGIGSNMPLHMFDAPLPGHPTFAVNLKAEHPDYMIETPERADDTGGRVYLADGTRGGRQRYWPEPKDDTPLGGLVGFLLSIISTMQNWRDEILFPYPGFRDRIVQISQRPDEGGLNLDMPEPSISALSNAGKMAAERLIDRFHPTGSEGGAGWHSHRRDRLATLLGAMHAPTAELDAVMKRVEWEDYLREIKPYNAGERAFAGQLLGEFRKFCALGAGTSYSLEKGAYKPLARLRITPAI